MPCSLPSSTNTGPKMEHNYFSYGPDEELKPVTVETCGYRSDLSFYLFFLSSSLPITDKLRLVKCSLNKPKHGLTKQVALASVPASSQASWIKARCKHTFFICRIGIKIQLHVWWGDKCI